jgi:Scd6-like Sm domain
MNDVVNAGMRVHLLSNDNICYEGVMYEVDEELLTVTLQNVRNLGTTTRGLRDTSGGDGGGSSSSSSEPPVADVATAAVSDDAVVHPYRVFRGQDIKDLRVVEDEEESTTATPSTSNPNTTTSSQEPPDEEPAPAAMNPTSTSVAKDDDIKCYPKWTQLMGKDLIIQVRKIRNNDRRMNLWQNVARQQQTNTWQRTHFLALLFVHDSSSSTFAFLLSIISIMMMIHPPRYRNSKPKILSPFPLLVDWRHPRLAVVTIMMFLMMPAPSTTVSDLYSKKHLVGQLSLATRTW